MINRGKPSSLKTVGEGSGWAGRLAEVLSDSMHFGNFSSPAALIKTVAIVRMAARIAKPDACAKL